MDDYHFSNIAKKKNLIIFDHVGEIKTCNSIKTLHIICNENKIVKDLMNAFLN